MKLVDKTILITGASSGIGRELAVQLARRGNRLVLMARREELLQEPLQHIPQHEYDHLHFQCDVSDAAQVKDICEWLINAGIRIDIMILNAGISGGFDVKEIDLDSFRRQINVNFFGAVYFVKHRHLYEDA